MAATRRNPAPAVATVPPEKPEYRVEALAKGLRLLSLFDEQRPTWRVSDLAAVSGLPMPTVYRVVMTLTAEGYLDHLPNGDYRPGVRTLTLGGAALRSLDLVALATPKLQRLAEATGETVNLAVLTGDRVLYLVRLRNSDLVTANIQVGSTLPAVHTSIGKLMLADLDEADLRERITDSSFPRPARPERQGVTRRAEPGTGPDPYAGLGAAGRGTGPRPALDGRADHRPVRPADRRGQPGRPGPGLVDPAHRPRAAAGAAGHLRRDLPAHLRRMSERLNRLHPGQLTADQRAVYDAVAGGRRAQGPQLFPLVDPDGGLEGPFNAFLLQPRLGFALQALGAAVRYETTLSDRAREIAILVTAVAAGATFEWNAHEAVGRHAGLDDDDLDAIRATRWDALSDPTERMVAVSVHALCLRGDLDDDEYQQATDVLGEAGVFELLTLTGYYLALAMQLRVFRVS